MELLSVIVPCFNEEAVLTTTYSRLAKALGQVAYQVEFVFVDDGSTDATLSILQTLAEKDNRVRIVSFSRNFGHEAAVTAGLRNCFGSEAAIIDADLQDPPECIPQMRDVLKEQCCEIVYGRRIVRKGESLFKKLTSYLFYRLLNLLSDVKFPTETGDFRVMNRRVIDVFNGFREHGKYVRGLIAWTGFRQVPFDYVREPRFAGETKYSPAKLFNFALSSIFSFSSRPLHLALNLGFASVFVAFGLLLWAVLERLINPAAAVQGWASTIVVVLFLGGVQLLSIGILGQYLGGIFEESKARPEYIVDRRINFPQKVSPHEKKTSEALSQHR